MKPKLFTVSATIAACFSAIASFACLILSPFLCSGIPAYIFTFKFESEDLENVVILTVTTASVFMLLAVAIGFGWLCGRRMRESKESKVAAWFLFAVSLVSVPYVLFWLMITYIWVLS